VVPGLLTRGRAKQLVPPAHCVVWNLPPTHWEKPPFTQAFSPSVHGESGVNLAKSAFNFWAATPLSCAKGFGSCLLLSGTALADAKRARATTTAENFMFSLYER